MNLFENAIYNTKFIENNLSLFTEKKENTKKVEQDISTKKNVVQKYTDKDVEAFKKITAESQKDNSSKLYTKKDFSIFNNILNKENNIDKKNQLKI